MIDLAWSAVSSCAVAVIGPLGMGWLWWWSLTRSGVQPPSLGMAYWMGLMTLGGIVLAGYGVGASQLAVTRLVTFISLTGWAWWVAKRPRGARESFAAAWPLMPLAAAGIAYCVVVPVLIWDAYVIWLARVRLLEQWIPLSRFEGLNIAHPGYPFLGAAAWWWTTWAARVPVEAGRVVFLFAYVAFFLAVLRNYRAHANGRFLLLCSGLAYGAFFLQVINGYQDGFLMVSAGMVALAFLHWGDRGLPWILPLAAGLSLIKAEGAVIGLVLVLSWFLAEPWSWVSCQRRAIALGLIGFMVVLASWPFLQARNGLAPTAIQGDAFRIRSFESLFEHMHRIPRIAHEMLHDYLAAPVVTLLFLAATAYAAVHRRRLERQQRFLLLALMLHSLFVAVVFLATQLPFEWHLTSASGRLLLQSRCLALLFIFEMAVGYSSGFNVPVSSSSVPGRAAVSPCV